MEDYVEEFVERFPSEDMSFLEITKEFLDFIEEHQAENFEKAGELIGESLMEDRLVHVVGTGGHTNIPAYDMFFRAGGFIPINYIIPAGAHYGTVAATHGMRIERTPGYMRQVIDYHPVKEGDVAIIFNNVGVNAAAVDAALECQDKGATVIAVAGSPWAEGIPEGHKTRHPSDKNLKDLGDLFIDDYNPLGDTVLTREGLESTFAPISQMNYSYIVRRIEEETVDYLLDHDFTPPTLMSANVEGGDEANEEYIKEYYNRIKYL